MRLPVQLRLPADVVNLKEPTVQELSDSLLERRSIDAGPGGLAGKRIDFVGLQGTITDVLVRIELADGRKWTTIVRPSQSWVEIAAAQGPARRRSARTSSTASGTSPSAPTTCSSCSACC